jgi:hypothetical protein
MADVFCGASVPLARARPITALYVKLLTALLDRRLTWCPGDAPGFTLDPSMRTKSLASADEAACSCYLVKLTEIERRSILHVA